MLRPAPPVPAFAIVAPPASLTPTGRAVHTTRHTVFEAVLGSRRFAIKVPHRDARAVGFVDRLIDLGHPHVAQHMGLSGPHGGVVLAWVDGLAMNEWCARSPVPACFELWLDQGLDALAAIHARGLCHTQVTPSHLIVDESGALVLVGCSMVRPIQTRRDALLDITALVRALVASYMGASRGDGDETENLCGGLLRRGIRADVIAFVERALRGEWGSACAMREALLDLPRTRSTALATPRLRGPTVEEPTPVTLRSAHPVARRATCTAQILEAPTMLDRAS